MYIHWFWNSRNIFLTLNSSKYFVSYYVKNLETPANNIKSLESKGYFCLRSLKILCYGPLYFFFLMASNMSLLIYKWENLQCCSEPGCWKVAASTPMTKPFCSTSIAKGSWEKQFLGLVIIVLACCSSKMAKMNLSFLLCFVIYFPKLHEVLEVFWIFKSQLSKNETTVNTNLNKIRIYLFVLYAFSNLANTLNVAFI